MNLLYINIQVRSDGYTEDVDFNSDYISAGYICFHPALSIPISISYSIWSLIMIKAGMIRGSFIVGRIMGQT